MALASLIAVMDLCNPGIATEKPGTGAYPLLFWDEAKNSPKFADIDRSSLQVRQLRLYLK